MNRHLITFVSLIFCAAPAVAATANQKSTTDENGVTWNYTLRDGAATLGWGSSSTPATMAGGDLVIPSALDGYPVGEIGRYSFYKCGSVTSVVIPSTVTNIASYAFYNSASITNITIPASIKKVCDNAFYLYNNDNLSIHIEDLASWCSVEIEDGYTPMGPYSRVIQPSRLFNSYTSPFYGATAVYFNNELFPAEGELVIPDGVSKISSGAFLADVGGNRNGGEIYSHVDTLVLPDSVREIGSFAFYEFNYFTTPLTLPASLEKIGKCAFGFSMHISSVTVPKTMPFVENLAEGLFRGRSTAPTIDIGEDNANYRHIGNGVYSPDGRVFVMPKNREIGSPKYYEVELPDSVERIAPCAFWAGQSGVRRVVLPESVREIPDCAFMRCSAMTNVVLGAQTTKIGTGAFDSCSGLLSLEIPDTVTEIGDYAFCGCNQLIEIRLPAGIRNVGEQTIRGKKFENVVIPDAVTNLAQEAVCWCEGLTNLVIGAGVRGMGGYTYADGKGQAVSVKTPVSGTIYKCTALKSVTFRSADTIVGEKAFSYCGLEELTIPAGITIMNNAFADVTISHLKLKVPDGEESFTVSYLANAAGIRGIISTLEIPSSCTTVDMAALNQLVNLTTVTFKGASFAAVSNETLLNLRACGIDIVYIPEGGTAADGEAELKERLNIRTSVTVESAVVRAGDAKVMDVRYVVAGARDAFAVRSLAFQDGVKSFANVIRTTSFVDGTAANAFGEVTANEPHVVSWKIADDWNVKLGHVAFAVMTVETAELPLKLMQIPASGSHPAVRFSHNALTSARVLDALLWHYADPDCALTLTDGKLYDGGTLLASGAEPTAAGTAYVFAKMGYRLLAGDELEYVNAATRLGLVPEGARQYAVENPAQ